MLAGIGYNNYLAPLELQQNLQLLAQEELAKEEENFHFKNFLRHQDSRIVDEQVFALNETIAPQIDCTSCGNCCKSLMVNITAPESERLAAYLQMDLPSLKEKYIETSLQGDMILNTIPCHFLAGTSCSIYEHRFTECREFPRLHRENFTGRLFSTFMHYGRCPIIYNVIEQLKATLHFNTEPVA